MRITKTHLKQIIKEELETLLFEQADQGDFAAKMGIPARHDPGQKLARAAAASGYPEDKLIALIKKKYAKFVQDSKNELDTAVKAAGSPDNYIVVMVGELADKLSAGNRPKGEADKPGLKPKPKAPRHIRRERDRIRGQGN